MVRKIKILTAENEGNIEEIKDSIHGVNGLADDFSICGIAYSAEEYIDVNKSIKSTEIKRS